MPIKNKVGRPSLGETRKVSLTLSEPTWSALERVAAVKGMSMSAVLRLLLEDLQGVKRLGKL